MNFAHLKASLLAAAMAAAPAGLLAGADFPLDLSKTANVDFKDEVANDGKGGWSDQGPQNDMRGFDVSRKDYEGVLFNVIDPAKNGGRAILTFDNPHFKTGLGEAKVELKTPFPEARYLYLLHSSCYTSGPNGDTVGFVEVVFDDGSRVKKDIKKNEEVTDWWDPLDLPNGKVVFRKPNKSAETGAYLSKIELAEKDRKIASVSIKGAGKVCWIVIGATLSSKDVDISKPDVVFKANEEWAPIDISDAPIKPGTALDISSWIDAPAGKHGRAIIGKDGSMVFEKRPDVPVRLKGCNSSFYPEDVKTPELLKKNAAETASAWARQGYNLWRTFPESLLVDWNASEDSAINPQMLAAYDAYFAEAKKNGIYLFLVIDSGRLGRKDGQKAYDDGVNSYCRMFLGEKELRNGWEKLAKGMLEHVNPLTDLAWKDDPSIICVEPFNEQEFGFSFDRLSPETLDMFNAAFRAWAIARYKTTEALAAIWGRPELADEAVFEKFGISKLGWGQDREDLLIFQRELMVNEILWCESALRKIGYKGLVGQYNLSGSMSGSVARWRVDQAAISNTYHSHPTLFMGQGSVCRQTSSAGTFANHWRGVAASRFADRPCIVTEHNQAFWNKYQHEEGLIFGGYSAFQGFSSLVVHASPVTQDRHLKDPNNCFSVGLSPIARANEFIAAALYMRGDVKKTAHRVEIQVPIKHVESNCNGFKGVDTDQSKISLATGLSLAFPDLKKAAGVPEIPPPDVALPPGSGAEISIGSMYVNAVDAKKSNEFDIDSFFAKLKERGILPKSNVSDPKNGVFQTETGEITLRANENLVKVETALTEGVSLEANKGEKVGRLVVKNTSAPACVAAISMDGKPLNESKRIVFIYSTYVVNSGMTVSGDWTILRRTGKQPLLMQTGKLSATLENANGEKMSLYALRVDGSRLEKLPLTCESGLFSGDKLQIELDTTKLKNGPTSFFELVAEDGKN